MVKEERFSANYSREQRVDKHLPKDIMTTPGQRTQGPFNRGMKDVSPVRQASPLTIENINKHDALNKAQRRRRDSEANNRTMNHFN